MASGYRANGRHRGQYPSPFQCVVHVGNGVVCGGELLENDPCVNVGDSTSGVVMGWKGIISLTFEDREKYR